MVAAESDGSEHVFFIARDDYADWDLAIVRAIGGVEGAAAGVEADLSAEMPAEGGFEGVRVDGGCWHLCVEHGYRSIIRGCGPERKDIAEVSQIASLKIIRVKTDWIVDADGSTMLLLQRTACPVLLYEESAESILNVVTFTYENH